MRVVGRTSLSPKHTVYLLDVGGRVLILGAGPQGAPTLLGELDRRRALAPPRFDHRLGDDVMKPLAFAVAVVLASLGAGRPRPSRRSTRP